MSVYLLLGGERGWQEAGFQVKKGDELVKVGGNVQYLYKCECYYQKGDIKCLQRN